MSGHDLTRRRRIVKTSMVVAVDDKSGSTVSLLCEIQIVTYGYARSLIAWFAEGLGDTLLWVGGLDGDKMYKYISSEVQRAYTFDSNQ